MKFTTKRSAPKWAMPKRATTKWAAPIRRASMFEISDPKFDRNSKNILGTVQKFSFIGQCYLHCKYDADCKLAN